MRQNFVHLSKAEKRPNQNQKADNDSDDEIDDLKQVTVKFARTGDAEKIKKAKERSYHFISQIGADEPWCETLIHPKESQKAEFERRKIGETSMYDYGFESIPENEYFSQLLSDKLSFEAVENIQDDGANKQVNLLAPITLSKQQIRKLSLLDQIKVILKDAKVLSFDSLKEMLTDVQLTDEKILRQLVLCGMMIRGNWTLQSDILYPESFVSFRGGVSGELMSRGRDYVIYKLLKNEMKLITKKRLCVITQLPVFEVQEILESVACLKNDGKTKYWDFIKIPDYDFEKRHQDIAERQATIWKSLEEKFTEMEAEKQEKRSRKKSLRDSKHF
jgi:DNA-directed RNA polymerase III subunit RPC5